MAMYNHMQKDTTPKFKVSQSTENYTLLLVVDCLFFFLYLKKKNLSVLYGSIANEQCCDSFGCIAE